MRWLIAVLSLTALAATASPGISGELSVLDLLRQELAAKVPPDWQLHVTRRDETIVAFVTPPYQQAFDLWYDPEKLRATMVGLCPAREDVVWKQMAAGEQLTLVPTVGGKTADTMGVVCRSDGAR